ncbi:MAG: hypothetical protein PHQ52_04370 [Candidatus Omnitrophica bacterium]|nr:hypothetical protein [Candidatus Omnitrophota bacterium]
MRKSFFLFLFLFSCILACYSWFYYKNICSRTIALKKTTDTMTDTLAENHLVYELADIPAAIRFPQLTEKEQNYISRKIYANECGSLEKNLVFWNVNEDFPSLGIGHFIWYPQGVDPGFEETFPELVGFMEQKGVAVPIWLMNRPAPWKNRHELLQDINSERMLKFKKFLKDTINVQTEYILLRSQKSLRDILRSCDEEEKKQLTKKLEVLINAHNGVYAITDYVNFKGTGLSLNERYNGQGWGLKQVLQSMPDSITEENALSEFSTACENLLDLRVKNAPAGKNEEKWLIGWKKRVRIYSMPKEYDRVYWE